MDAPKVEADTRRWIERAVIGLNLCPFAKSVWVKGQVRIVVHASGSAADVLDALAGEARALLAARPEDIDTTLLVLPHGFSDFLAFIDLVRQGERRLRKGGHDGALQLASFHPRFEFADAPAGDAAHRTNRSPHPTLHLLRESSIDRAVAAFPDPESIYGTNIETLRRLGDEGWRALGVEAG